MEPKLISTWCNEETVHVGYRTKLHLRYKNKHGDGAQRTAQIIPGPEENHYIALFDVANVYFEICVDNF